jgi:hypothetical protein
MHKNATWSPNIHQNSRLRLPHHSIPLSQTSFKPQLNSWSPHVEPIQLNQPSKAHMSAERQPPASIFQVIQHPCGISPTKPKITKNIPAYPTPFATTQERNHISHCTCGAPVREQDRDNWRSSDTNRRTLKWGFDSRFRRRFSRRSSRRFWDW